MLLLALFAAAVADTGVAEERRVRLQELLGRLGQLPERAAAGTLEDRLSYVERMWGWEVKVEVREVMEREFGISAQAWRAQSALGPFLVWLGRERAVRHAPIQLFGPSLPSIRDWWIGENADLYAFTFDAANEAQMAWHRDLAQTQGGAVPPAAVVHDFGDGWTVQELTKTHQLDAEGRSMGNCIGTIHAAYVVEGLERIFSLRTPEGRPVVDISVEVPRGQPNEVAIKEVKGRGNQVPAPRYRERVLVFLRAFFSPEVLSRRVSVDFVHILSPQDPEWILRLTGPFSTENVNLVRRRRQFYWGHARRYPDMALPWAEYIDGVPTPETWALAAQSPRVAVAYAATYHDNEDMTPEGLGLLRASALRKPEQALEWAQRVDSEPADDTRAMASMDSGVATLYMMRVDFRAHPVTEAAVRGTSDEAQYRFYADLNDGTVEGAWRSVQKLQKGARARLLTREDVARFLRIVGRLKDFVRDHGLSEGQIYVWMDAGDVPRGDPRYTGGSVQKTGISYRGTYIDTYRIGVSKVIPEMAGKLVLLARFEDDFHEGLPQSALEDPRVRKRGDRFYDLVDLS